MQAKEHIGKKDSSGLTKSPPAVERIAVLPDAGAARMGEEISLLDLLRVMRRYKLSILASVLAGLLLPGLLALLMTPTFRAQTLVAPVHEGDERSRLVGSLAQFGGIAALTGIDIPRSSRKNEAIALLRSRTLTEQFIKDEKLRPVLFGEQWEDKDPRWASPGSRDVPSLAQAIELFDERVRQVYEDRKTGLVEVAIEWEDPQLAAHWANELVRRVNLMLRERATRESEQAIAYLQSQLKQTSAVELQQALHRLVEAEMKEIILANINEEYAFRVIDAAVAPEKPFKPVLAPMLIMGAAMGLLGGILLALLRDFLRRRSPQDA